MNDSGYEILKAELKDICMETERLRIRRYSDADEDGFFAIFRDPRTMAMDNDVPMTEKNAGFYRRIGMVKNGGLLFLCISDRVTDEFIGYVLLNRYPAEREATITIGFSLVPERQGRGYGYEAVSSIIAALRSGTPVKQLLANARTDNIPSLGLLRKLGFASAGMDGQDEYFALDL